MNLKFGEPLTWASSSKRQKNYYIQHIRWHRPNSRCNTTQKQPGAQHLNYVAVNQLCPTQMAYWAKN